MSGPCEAGEQLLQALETCELPTFSHEQHVQVAWLLLGRCGLAETLLRLPRLLRAYAASKGRPGLYHETITFAFVCIVHERIAAEGIGSWTSFRERHADLFDRELLTRYYPDDVLSSERARQTFVLPRMLRSQT